MGENFLENHNLLKEELDVCFKTLEKLLSNSFILMENDPGRKAEITNVWKNHILKFISCTYKNGEKYNNKDVFKSITKALMFGK